MRFSAGVVLVSLTVGHALAAPQQIEQRQLHFQDASLSDAFSIATPASSLFGWISSAVEKLSSTKQHVEQSVAEHHEKAMLKGDPAYAAFEKPDFPDKTIWEVIQENEYLTDLKKVLKYSGKGTRELLDDKSKKLTFLAPINWHNKRHDQKELNWFDMGHWNSIEAQIHELETLSTRKDDDEKKRRKRKAIAYLIDSTIRYHVVHSHGEPLKAYEIAQNSSVATDFSIGDGAARKVIGNLLDGEQFRLRVGKSLLPRPAIYFNFYSQLVYADVNVGGSLVHAISLPLLLPASALQTLFFSTPELAGTTSSLQKTHVQGYLEYPFNRTALHNHEEVEEAKALASISPLSMHHGLNAKKEHEHRHYYHSGGKGQEALTFFAPSNLAWYRLPPLLRLFLQSPFGTNILRKVLALHSVPFTVFYADFLHAQKDERFTLTSHEQIAATDILASSEWLWGPTSESPSVPMGNVNVTRYTFKTACPKLHFNRTKDGAMDYTFDKHKFETIDVAVYRYKILPGGRGPLQTRISVQDVPVIFQDIAVGNGALHVIDHFIKPKGYHGRSAGLESPYQGIWALAAAEAEKFGFGSVDMTTELF